MVIRSLYQPVYHREKKGGLPGAVSQPVKNRADDGNKTFEDYLTDSFRGEVVQQGTWFAPQISELSKRNLRKL
ncbi:hypothetical protein [Leptospira sp. GIMC2001]|uniref:hypothetical protein n=1 Tax=Leptospira sp. GIMC2001 TaxID=1513297 RepID=UPI00234A91E4|nr:hypothetical protein [Leptospira sp. GIMC2001]WCL50274.1 hypothetical protein O4O04_05480 [Leptospira sp. GIMC2001]